MTYSNQQEGVAEGLILNLVSGAVGDNVVGRLIGGLNQRPAINSIAEIVGRGKRINFVDAPCAQYGRNGT